MAKFNFKINITTLLAIAFGVVVLFWFNGRKNDEINRWESNYEAKSVEFETFKSEIDGVLVVKDKAIELLGSELKDVIKSDSSNAELVKKYKKLAMVTKIETEFITDTIEIPFPVYVKNDTSFIIPHECYTLNLSLFDGGLAVNDVSIHNVQDIISGRSKSGLFATEYSISVKNSNKCIQTTGITTYVVVDKKKWWENPLIVGLGSFATGYLVSEFNN